MDRISSKQKLLLEEQKFNDTNAYLFYLNTKNILICPLNSNLIYEIWESFGCPRHTPTEKLLKVDRRNWDDHNTNIDTPTAPVQHCFQFAATEDVVSTDSPSAPCLEDIGHALPLGITQQFFGRRLEPGHVAISSEGVSTPDNNCPGYLWPKQKMLFARYEYVSGNHSHVQLDVTVSKQDPGNGYVLVECRNDCSAELSEGYLLYGKWGYPQGKICTSQTVSVTKDGMPRYPRYIDMNGKMNPYTAIPVTLLHNKNRVHQCYSLDTLEAPPTPAQPRYSMVEKQKLAQLYTPVIVYHPEEEHKACSVESFLRNTELRMVDGKPHRCIPEKSLGPYPYCNSEVVKGDPAIQQVPVYAFWVCKQYVSEITYFVFFPFNKGKTMPGGVIVGNHVGDWEHITVRLGWVYEKYQWRYQPFEVYGSVHHVGVNLKYKDIAKYQDTRPILYTALGSHGFHGTPGTHTYLDIQVGGQNILALTDECGEGDMWTTDILQFYDYSIRTGLDNQLEELDWPTWMSKNYAKNPGSAIYRWGNPKITHFAKPPLEVGPTGPIDKVDVWSEYIFE